MRGPGGAVLDVDRRPEQRRSVRPDASGLHPLRPVSRAATPWSGYGALPSGKGLTQVTLIAEIVRSIDPFSLTAGVVVR